MNFTSKQRSYLKGLASAEDAIFQIGKSSITPTMVQAIDDAIEKRELIKISVLKNCMDDPHELATIIAERTHSDVVIVIDALAAAEPARLFKTVQLTDGGIVPGSGVGNSRQEFSKRTLGVPVIAVGVPTVVDASGLFRQAELELDVPQGMLVTVQDVDARVREMGRFIGYGCDLALHRGLTLGEIPAFLS